MKIIALSLFLLSSFVFACADQFDVFSIRGHQISADYLKSIYPTSGAPDSIYQLSLKVLNRYYQRGLNPPWFALWKEESFKARYQQSLLEISEDWSEWFFRQSRENITVFSDYSRVTEGINSEVMSLTIQGEKYFFRPLNPENFDVVRRTYLAAHLNQWMKLGTVPKLKLVKVNNTYGVLSERVKGTSTSFYVDVDKASLNDNRAFEFLVGNIDVHEGNFLIGPDGKINVFDHSEAFDLSLRDDDANFFFGRELPTQYSREFIIAVQNESILDEVRIHLTTEEFNMFVFRREIILEHIKALQI